MLRPPWVFRRCLKSLSPLPTPQFFRRASTESHASVPKVLLDRARGITQQHDRLRQGLYGEDYDSSLARRVGELASVASALHAWDKAYGSISELKALLGSDDAEMRQIAQEELDATNEELDRVGHKLKEALSPKDPFADLPCLLEFRPGPGGLEGRFFTDSLFRMYEAYCERHGLATRTVKYEYTDDQKGAEGEMPLQEAVLEVTTPGAYDIFRGEAGMHRVQRVPATEAKGRTHTSAAAIWVLPSFPEHDHGGENNYNDPESDFYVDPKEVRSETMRARGAGGQHVNKTESAIRLTHIPTGIVVSMQDARSQLQNREVAWRILRSRMAQHRREAREAMAKNLKDSVLSKNQITRGDKIRTYNWSQNRVSDHRSGIDIYNLPDVMQGGESLDKIMDSIRGWQLEQAIESIIEEEDAAAERHYAQAKAKNGSANK